MKILILIAAIFFINTASACESVYGFARLGAGVAHYKHGGEYDGLAAQIDFGIAWELSDQWILDARIGHGSYFFEHDDADYVDYGNIGIEYRW